MIGKRTVDNVFEGKESLENLCRHTNTYYGVIPLSSWFAKEKRANLYQSVLWEFFDSGIDEEISMGAFLLLAEIAEEQKSVSIEFARRALTIWCRRKFQDEKIVAYVYNRFSYNRKEWNETLAQYDLLTSEVREKWGSDSLEQILHFCSVMLAGEVNCKMQHVDHFIGPELDQNLHLITKQVIGLVNRSEKVSGHFIDELLSSISDKSQKLSTRMLALQLLTMKKIVEQLDSSHIAHLFMSASLNAPSPLGTLLYNISRQMNGLNETEPIPLKLVARSNRYYLHEVYKELGPEIWMEILHAFHTEIKQSHRLGEIQYPEGFTNEMIVKDLMRKTNLKSPINPLELSATLNILVKELALPDTIEAFTIKSESADKGMIVLNRNVKSKKRQKFTLAHEIGHLLKHPFPESTNILVDEQVKEMIIEKDNVSQYVNLEWEKDANDFAHLLLLPSGSDEVNRLKEIQAAFIKNISLLSDDLEISMSVLASKLISVTKMEMILVISENGEVVFSKVSPYWEETGFSLFNSIIPSNSETYDYIHVQDFASTEKPGMSNLRLWGENAPDILMHEEVFATGYGKVYTFLYK